MTDVVATGDATLPAAPPLESTRRLIGASFDLLARATEEMRQASFYIGLIALGTVAPFALGTWLIEVVTLHLTLGEADALATSAAYGWYDLLAWPMVIGILVATFESRLLAVSLLGGRLVGRPLTVERGIARSRLVFWRSIGGTFLAGIPLSIAQALFAVVLAAIVPMGDQESFIAIVLATVLVGAPFAYVLTGIALGDVGAIEAIRRSFRVYRARKAAAAMVALFEVAAFLLILLGVGAGLDIALRIFDGLGLGADSGPAGLILVTLGVVAATFAFGTLLYTVTALSLAPQVVMFVGLTHATFGIDRVRPGADQDPDVPRVGRAPFRVITRSMWFGIIVAWVILGITALLLSGRGG